MIANSNELTKLELYAKRNLPFMSLKIIYKWHRNLMSNISYKLSSLVT